MQEKWCCVLTVLPYLLFGTAIVFVVLFFYSLFKQKSRIAALFALMCLSLSVYVFASAFEFLSNDLEAKKFFITLEYFGFSFLPALWLIISYKHYYNKNMTIKAVLLTCAIPFVTMFFNATKDYHTLYYTDIKLIEHGTYSTVYLSRGSWYYIFYLYSLVCLVISTAFFYKAWKVKKYSVRIQSFWLLIGSLSPLVGSIIYFFTGPRNGIDIIPYSFLVPNVIFFIVLFKYDFLEIKDIVRSYSFGQIKEGIFVIDEKNRIIDFNNSAAETFDWLDSLNVGNSILKYEEGKKIIEKSAGNKGDFFEVGFNKKGEEKVYEFKVSSLTEKGRIIGRLFLFQDITEQKLAIERLNYMATHDSLSEVYNRGKMMQEIEKTLSLFERKGGDLSLMMIDIDYFKTINDKYGHVFGDMVIRGVARAFKSVLKNEGVIGRYGGEEFIILLSGKGRQEAFEISENVREHIMKQQFTICSDIVNVTISIGLVTLECPGKAVAPQELINRADTALYTAKNSGRNNVKFISL